MAIDALAAAARAGAAPPRGSRPGAGFRLPERGRLSAAAPAAEVALSGMLTLQEVDPPEQRDRAARRRGQDLLAELAALQRTLLSASGDTSAPALHRLAGLVQAVPLAADPALRQAVAAIMLRCRVELARYRHDNSNITSSP
jgi:predicted ArsR family transcriptional regulator